VRPQSRPYLADVRTLDTLASHPAVAATLALHDAKHLGFEQPMLLAIHLDDHFALLPGAVEDLRAQDPRWRDVDIVAYAAQVAQFAADAKLDALFAAHASYIAAVEARFRVAVAKDDPAAWLAALFHAPGARFTIVPALMLGGNNYGVHTATDMVQIVGLGVPDAQHLPVVDDAKLELIVHEMTHSFVNPVIERHLGELEPVATPLYALVAPAMQRQHYGAVKIMLFESVVRAVTTLYARAKHGDRAAGDATRREVRRGFVWTAELAEVLRRMPGDLDAYVPQLVAFFAATANKYEHGLPPMAFLGPIDAVVLGDKLLVRSEDPALATYLDGVAQQIFKGAAPLAVATTRTFDDAPHTGLLAYGTAESNPVVASIAGRAGWKLDASGLQLGTKRFDGAGIVLIACWPRQDDPSRGVVVYTAARDGDVVGIHELFAGDTDYVVGKRLPDGHFQSLAVGDFPHAADGAWMLP
jgi:hypothetical protein